MLVQTTMPDRTGRHDGAPRLLAVAHGTASTAGRRTVEALAAAIAAQRPGTPVDLCFLDVVEPRLPACLDDRPTIAVPLLLSTGYHVQSDIPAAVEPFPATRVARHLGPHPLLVDAVLDRLGELGPAPAASTVLVAAGSTRPGAAEEIDATAAALARRLDHPVVTAAPGPELRAVLDHRRPPVRVATYLLAEGHFVDSIVRAAAGFAEVSAPLGVHPALVALAWLRYDEALGAVR
jgi:sirohydrochlorin ferrochelatase